MSKQKPLIAANWKMNPSPLLTAATPRQAPQAYQSHAAVDVVVFPTFLDIAGCVKAGLITGGQWGHPKPDGAFTGDISISMLKNAGCRYVLCGHSERRQYHGESDAFVAEQALAALEMELHPIVCVGETWKEREAGKEKDVIKRQIHALPLSSLSAVPCPLSLAYEPVWAIGTGKTATPAQAQEMHAFIRSLLPKELQASTRILYGGSVKGDNAHELLHQNDIDGALVGGASLKPAEFQKIVEAAMELAK